MSATKLCPTSTSSAGGRTDRSNAAVIASMWPAGLSTLVENTSDLVSDPHDFCAMKKRLNNLHCIYWKTSFCF